MPFTIGFTVWGAAASALVGRVWGSALYHIIFSLSSVSCQLIYPQSDESRCVFCERDKRVCMITGLTSVAISSMKYVGAFHFSDVEEWYRHRGDDRVHSLSSRQTLRLHKSSLEPVRRGKMKVSKVTFLSPLFIDSQRPLKIVSAQPVNHKH